MNPTNADSSIVFIWFDDLWQARAPLPRVPLRIPALIPPPGHPKENKMASRRQWLVLSLTFRQSNETGKPETPDWLWTQEKCRMGGRIPKHCVLNANTSIPRSPRVWCFQRTGGSALDLSDGNQRRITCAAPPKKHYVGSPQNGLGESPMLNRLDSLGKPRPPHRHHTEHPPTQQRFTNLPKRKIDEQPPQTVSRQRPHSHLT